MIKGTNVVDGVVEYDVYKLTRGGEILDGSQFLSEVDAEKFIKKRAKEVPYYCGCVYKTIDGVLQDANHLMQGGRDDKK